MNDLQMQKVSTDRGFVAALDQSGGSTPRTLAAYGIPASAYSSDEQMFDLVHQMRSRIIRSPRFDGGRLLAAILFDNTMERRIDDLPTSDYLWDVKGIVPILKVDVGLLSEVQGVQLMKPIPDLVPALERARNHHIFGTKMRSFIKLADPTGIDAVVAQQFELAALILRAGLVPILEPEIDIHSPVKAEAEALLKAAIDRGLSRLGPDDRVMLKLSLPAEDDFYADLVANRRVIRVLALSGGYTRHEAVTILTRNHGVIASFARALFEQLSAKQTDEQFDATLDEAVREIFEASIT